MICGSAAPRLEPRDMAHGPAYVNGAGARANNLRRGMRGPIDRKSSTNLLAPARDRGPMMLERVKPGPSRGAGKGPTRGRRWILKEAPVAVPVPRAAGRDVPAAVLELEAPAPNLAHVLGELAPVRLYLRFVPPRIRAPAGPITTSEPKDGAPSGRAVSLELRRVFRARLAPRSARAGRGYRAR